MIKACIGCCKFLVFFNGKTDGYFDASRGLRQENLLSPSLFILAEDVLSRALNTRLARVDEYSTIIAPCPSHLLFIDDIILFICAKRRSIMKMMGIVEAYTHSLGQGLNSSKCNLFLPSNAPSARVHVVMATTHFDAALFLLPTWGCQLVRASGKSITSNISLIALRSTQAGGNPNYFPRLVDWC